MPLVLTKSLDQQYYLAFFIGYNYLFLILIYIKPCCHVMLVMSTVDPHHFDACLQPVACWFIALKCAT